MNDEYDSMDWTPEMVLDEAKKEAGNHNPDKALVLFLYDENGQYDIQSWVSGMKISEVISLLEVAKSSFLGELTHEE